MYVIWTTIRTGDSTSNWEFVQMNIPLIIGIGLSAQPVSGCDIGGFCAAWQVGYFKKLNDLTIFTIVPYSMFRHSQQV